MTCEQNCSTIFIYIYHNNEEHEAVLFIDRCENWHESEAHLNSLATN